MTSSSQGVRGPAVPFDRREDYIAVLRRQRWLVAAVALSVFGLVALISFTKSPVYTARADILVGSGIQTSSGPRVEPNMDTEAQLASSTAVAELAAANLPLKTDPAKLATHVEVAVPENTQILQIAFTDGDAEQARLGAQEFANAYLSFRSTQETEEATNRIQELATAERDLRSNINDLRAQVQDPSTSDEDRAGAREQLDRKLAQLEFIQSQQLVADTVTIDPGRIVGQPTKPKAPSSPNHRLDLALGLLAGIGLAFALAYVRDRSEQRFEGATAMERWLDAPVLAVIPTFRKEHLWARSGVVQLYAANPPVAEAYRTLRTSVLRISRQRRLQSIMVASARAGEGKSTSAAMLSIALASSGKRVILISADLRTPAGNRYMMVPTSPGLTDLLTGYIDSVKQVLQATDVAGLTVLPSGAMPLDSSPTELLQSDRMLKVLEECADADYVIIDVPSVLTVADALVLAPLTDGVLFVAAARRTSPEMVELARVQLERMGAHIIGGILVGARKLEGVNPSYYYSVHPGTEMVRAGMSRSKRPAPSEASVAANYGADIEADISSGGAGSETYEVVRPPAESVERVVSIPPHAEAVQVAPSPRSNERRVVERQQASTAPAPPSPAERPDTREVAASPPRDRPGAAEAPPAAQDRATTPSATVPKAPTLPSATPLAARGDATAPSAAAPKAANDEAPPPSATAPQAATPQAANDEAPPPSVTAPLAAAAPAAKDDAKARSAAASRKRARQRQRAKAKTPDRSPGSVPAVDPGHQDPDSLPADESTPPRPAGESSPSGEAEVP